MRHVITTAGQILPVLDCVFLKDRTFTNPSKGKGWTFVAGDRVEVLKVGKALLLILEADGGGVELTWDDIGLHFEESKSTCVH